MPGSKIFVGHRALGFVSNQIPLQLRYIQKRRDHLIITCVGNAFHTYGISRLSLLSISNKHDSPITSLNVNSYFVFTACEGIIFAWRRGTEVAHEYKTSDVPVRLLLPFGRHLIAINDDSLLQIWDIDAEEVYGEIKFDNATFKISSIMHPTTYLNKVLLGGEQGSMQLWNVRTNKLIHTFDNGWHSAITVLEQAPAVDVVAIGLGDGRVILHNLKFNETIMTLTQEWGPVTSISFRSDAHPIMATGSNVGHIALWDLEEKKLFGQMRDAHSSLVSGMKFLPNEPIMITSSSDNSIKMWIFDLPDGSGRLLRIRDGHMAPPNMIRFHGDNGQNILSAGQDSTLKSFSTVKDHLNKNLGQASYNRKAAKKKSIKYDRRKMPPIIHFASGTTREKEWDNIAACHRGTSLVTTWSYDRVTMGQHKLRHKRFKEEPYRQAVAQCAEITCCGNFVLIGYDSGHVDKYNIQSGIYRGSYCCSDDKAHVGAIRGISTDDLNQIVVTGGSDCLLKFWHFARAKHLDEIETESAVIRTLLHRESAMLAVSLEDFCIVIVDIETHKIVRTFEGHINQITDLAFTPDSKWLISSSMDCTIRVWDLPSARLIDCFMVSSPCTSIAVSPTCEYLATTHVSDLGIHLWSNTTLYGHISLRPLPDHFIPGLLESKTSGDDVSGDDDDEELLNETYKSAEQISDELVTLSLLPHSRWTNILNLDVIKKRNRPKEPPKVPKSAPFFIPTIPGLKFKFDSTLAENERTEDDTALDTLVPLSSFQKKLLECSSNDGHDYLMNDLKRMGPAAVDVEIRSLSPDGGGSVVLIKHFIRFLHRELKSLKDFELIQAYLGLFTKLHADMLSSTEDVKEDLNGLLRTHRSIWTSLQTKFNRSLCIVNYLKSSSIH